MSYLHPVPENHPVHSPTTMPPNTRPHRVLLIPAKCSNWIWRTETVGQCFVLDQNHDIYNCPQYTGRKRWERERITLIYQLIFQPWVPQLMWKSSGRCDLQAAVMHGCKNGWAYAQSPVEQREVLGTIFCPLCYCKFHWFESVWSMTEQIKFQNLQLRKKLMRIIGRNNTENPNQKNPPNYMEADFYRL